MRAAAPRRAVKPLCPWGTPHWKETFKQAAEAFYVSDPIALTGCWTRRGLLAGG